MDLIAAVHPAYVVSGLAVGILVGMTGVGGGSLMTPLLVLAFGFKVTTAVGTDLLFAAITKSVGVAVHGRGGTVDWRVTRRLAMGSLPAAALTIAMLALTRLSGHAASPLLRPVLGAALLVTAVCLFARHWLGRFVGASSAPPSPRRQAAATVAVGALLGVLVTCSSVGAGAIGMTALVLLYPRAPLPRLVGSDIAHAVPLTLLAGAGYWLLGAVDWPLLGSLLLGSIPGIVIGSRLALRVPDLVLRPVMAAVLAVAGIQTIR
jgi:uncharacterized membrane protein YfcA